MTPYIVAEDLGKGCYCLEDANGKLLKTAINCHRLKKWFEPDAGRLVCKSIDGDPDSAHDGDACKEYVHDSETIDVDAHDEDAIDVDACNGGDLWKRIRDVSLC